MIEKLTALQGDLASNIRTLLDAYDRCTDPALRTQLISQTQSLSTQMSRIETALFHQQTVDADDTLEAAFNSARGFTSQIDALNDQLERVSELVSVAAKVVQTVTVIVGYLPA